jgi:hypothetical protein
MVDGFHWTRVTSKQLRFLYEDVTMVSAPDHMAELAQKIDHRLREGFSHPQPAVVATSRNQPPTSEQD